VSHTDVPAHVRDWQEHLANAGFFEAKIVAETLGADGASTVDATVEVDASVGELDGVGLAFAKPDRFSSVWLTNDGASELAAAITNALDTPAGSVEIAAWSCDDEPEQAVITIDTDPDTFDGVWLAMTVWGESSSLWIGREAAAALVDALTMAVQYRVDAGET
jgi:hypothetical protein